MTTATATLARGTVVAITNARGTRKGVNHIVRGVDPVEPTAVQMYCGQSFLTGASRLDHLSKIATPTDRPAECATCRRYA